MKSKVLLLIIMSIHTILIGQNYCKLHFCITDFFSNKDVSSKLDSIVFDQNSPIVLTGHVVCKTDTIHIGLLSKVKRKDSTHIPIHISNSYQYEKSNTPEVSIWEINLSKDSIIINMSLIYGDWDYKCDVHYINTTNKPILNEWEITKSKFIVNPVYGNEDTDIDASIRRFKLLGKSYAREINEGIFDCSF